MRKQERILKMHSGEPAEKRLTIRQDRLEDELLPLLVGKVFHVTSLTGYRAIVSDGFIDSNGEGAYPFTTPFSQSCFGTLNAYVNLCDLRDKSINCSRRLRSSYDFLCPVSGCERSTSFAHMILSVHAYDGLIPWTAARTGSGDTWRVGLDKYVPRLECWDPYRLSLGLIAAVYIVTVTAPPCPNPAEMLSGLAWDEMWGEGGPQRFG